jgi:hypothetical protein
VAGVPHVAAPADAGLPPLVEALLAGAGFGPGAKTELLGGGANNRVFRVVRGGAAALLKVYFRHPGDSRDRLGTEYGFAEFAWRHGVRALPRPIAASPEASAALFEYIPGAPVSEVGEAEVDQALEFVEAINRHRDAAGARALAPASEACFSIPEHVTCVGRRVSRLATMPTQIPIDAAAAAFVNGPLVAAWRDVVVRTEAALAARPELSARIPSDDDRLSPCDFGFHNAIAAADGTLRFIDFEYAGWDDPGRLVADFFCQPAVPVPSRFLERVVDRVTASLSSPELHRERIQWLLPVYQIRWCCILLNEFLQVGEDRRRFSGNADVAARKSTQLDKAVAALRGLRPRS